MEDKRGMMPFNGGMTPPTRFGIKTIVFASLISLVAGVAITTRLDVTSPLSAQNLWKEPPVKEAPAFGPRSFADLAKRLVPSVVNISTTQVIRERGRAPFPEFRTPFDEFPGEDIPRDGDHPPSGGEEREFKRQSLGSGFIINKEGYILTNNHVIEDASEILVTLGEKKKEYKAKVIGKDEKLDIALIKIDAAEELLAVPLGDSDSLDIGEWVVAIGNPFGLGGTVTAGIVSQKGRVIGAGPYDNFIQTDASINPGSSGGPLFNLKGEVVGLNTAIIEGGQGIGFATPINMAKAVLTELREKGSVTRGWIGVSIQDVTPDMAPSFGLKEPMGALISSVVSGDPADEAGIKAGDVIIEFDGKPILEANALPRTVASTTPGKTVKVKVVRDGSEMELSVKVEKKKEGEEEAAAKEHEEAGKPAISKKLGLTVMDITQEFAERYGFRDKAGVLVQSVRHASPATEAGIRKGDVIKEVNRVPVKNSKEFRNELDKAAKKEVVLFLIKRGDNAFYATVKIKSDK